MLATPLTTCLVVLGKHVPGLKFFDILLGDEPVLTPDVSFYQRLLSRDEDEAADMLQRHAQRMSPIELCDSVLLPAIVHARRDWNAGLLTDDEYEYVLKIVHSLAEQQDVAAAAKAWRSLHSQNGQTSPAKPLTVLACPVQDGAELTALRVFEQLLDPDQFTFEIVSGEHVIAESIAARRSPTCRHLHRVAPLGRSFAGSAHHPPAEARLSDQKIVVARWVL